MNQPIQSNRSNQTQSSEAGKTKASDRQNRLSELKNQIASGTYHINTQAIAQKIVDKGALGGE